MSASAVTLSSPRHRINTGYVLFIALAGALCGFLFGFDSAVINGAVPGLQASFNSSTTGTGFEVASILLGCAIGALVGGRLADDVGRERTMLIVGVVFAVTAVLTSLVGSALIFTVVRFVSGIAVGAASVVAPLYLAEISPAHMRGRLASLQQMGIVVGIFVAFLSDWLIERALRWRSGSVALDVHRRSRAGCLAGHHLDHGARIAALSGGESPR